MTILCGLDYSINSPGLCIYDTEKDLTFENLLLYNKNDKKKYSGIFKNIEIVTQAPYSCNEERYKNTASWAFEIIKKNKVDFVCMEGYAMGSSAGQVFNIAENTSVIKQLMFDNNIPFIVPSPKTVKKHFTGSGNANKNLMVDTFEKRFCVSIAEIISQTNKYTSPTNDMVDSVAMMLYGLDYLKENNK